MAPGDPKMTKKPAVPIIDDSQTRLFRQDRTVGLDRRIGRETRRQPFGKGRR